MDDWDDVFDAGASEFDIAAAEQRQRQDRHWRMGYTDGAAAGREAGLQRGFESGLEQARALAHQYGRLQGFVCSALILATKTLPHDHPEVAALQAVYAEVYDMSADVAQFDDALVVAAGEDEVDVVTNPTLLSRLQAQLAELQERYAAASAALELPVLRL